MRVDDDGLLQALHEGMFETPLWRDFLKRLQAKTGAQSAALVFRPADEDAVVELHAGEQQDDAIRGLFADEAGAQRFPYQKMRANRVYSLPELLDLDTSGDTALLAQATTDLRLIRVTEPGGVDLWLGCGGGKAIGSATSALLTALAPHLRIALRCFATLERERFRSAITGQAFDRLKMGWLSLDASCRIIDATDNVEQLFQWGGLLRRGRYDRLVPASPTIDRQLAALLKHFAHNPESRPQAFCPRNKMRLNSGAFCFNRICFRSCSHSFSQTWTLSCSPPWSHSCPRAWSRPCSPAGTAAADCRSR